MKLSDSKLYDIAVIGGGIAGTAIARDAALRGASCVLFEKNALGSGTSSKSSKLIHGGLRYLEIAWNDLCAGRLSGFWKNLKFVFLALRETQRLHQLAPECIHPLPLLVPIYQGAARGPLSIYFGTFLYGLLARLTGNPHFSQILNSKEAVLKVLPDLNPQGLVGGVIVWDHTTDDLKLVQMIAASAKSLGAVLYEQSKVTSFENLDGIYHLTVEIYGKQEFFQCRKLINASGPWVDEVAGSKLEKMIVPVAGSHIEVKSFASHSAILEAADGRLFFMINRGDRARIGTTERVCETPDNVSATPDEIRYLLQSVNKFFPEKNFMAKDILHTDAGIRPLAKPGHAVSENQISREHEFVKDKQSVIHVLGVKLTDHRRAAEELMMELAPELSRQNPAVKTGAVTRTAKY